MRLRLAIVLAVLGAGVALALLTGLDGWAARGLLALQSEYQNALGGALRALRAHEPGAVGGFLALCFAYGVLHAAGPGHGKALLGGYGATSGASLRALVGLATLTALLQAAVAVVAVYAVVWAFGASRERVEGVADLIEPFALVALAALGLLLLWRGARGLVPDAPHEHGPDCGCAHLPDVKAVARANRREAVALVAAVALRPCTGALVMLALTWRLHLESLGVLGAFVMGAGTAVVTVAAAMLGAGARQGLLALMPGETRVIPAAQVALGGAVAVLAAMSAVRLLGG